MTDLELRHLRTVRAVAEAGSISKAAVLLHISQPAMTAQLQRIERILGGPLFERGPHGTLATALGQFVLRRAEALLTDMESLVVSAQDHHGVGPRRQLRIGAVPLLMMGGFVESLRTTVPSIDTHTMIEPSAPVLIRMLSTGTADLALFERFDSMQARALDGLLVRTLAVEPVFVMLPQGHAAATREAVQLADLAEDDWVLPPPHENGVRWRFLAACHAAGFTPRVRHYTSDGSTGRAIVALGAVALAAPGAQPNGLVIRPLAGDPVLAEILFAMNSQDELRCYYDRFFAAAVGAYRRVVEASPLFATWWRDHPEAQLVPGPTIPRQQARG